VSACGLSRRNKSSNSSSRLKEDLQGALRSVVVDLVEEEGVYHQEIEERQAAAAAAAVLGKWRSQ
jgi:hypothetical protein